MGIIFVKIIITNPLIKNYSKEQKIYEMAMEMKRKKRQEKIRSTNF